MTLPRRSLRCFWIILAACDSSTGSRDSGLEPAVASVAAPIEVRPLFQFAEARAKNDQGEVLELHADGKFAYIVDGGAVRGRLSEGKIFDEKDQVIATYTAEGEIADADPIWRVAERIELDGAYFIKGRALWTYASSGDMIETITGDVVLRASSVPPELRPGLTLAHVAMSKIFRRGRAPGSATPTP